MQDKFASRRIADRLEQKLTRTVFTADDKSFIESTHTPYAPRAGEAPPEPAWKGFDDFKDCVHPRQPTFGGKA